MKAPRIAGIDLVYAISVCVVIVFSLSVGLTGRESSLSVVSFDLIADTFAALFLFLNGITATLMMRRGNSSRRKAKPYLIRKGILFILIGFAVSFIWPVQILITLGSLFLIAPILTQLSGSILRVFYALVVIVAIVLFSIGDARGVSTIPDFGLSADFILGYIDYSIVSGYYGILPWSVFFISGVLYGRLDFLNVKIRRTGGFFSWLAIGLGSLVQIFAGSFFISLSSAKDPLIFPFFSSPGFNVISFILISSGLSIVLLNLFVKWGEQKHWKDLKQVMQRMGSIKHSLYVNHLVYGLVLIMLFGQSGVQSLGVELSLIGFYLGVSFLFCWLWKKQFNLGPVEWVLKILSGSNEKT